MLVPHHRHVLAFVVTVVFFVSGKGMIGIHANARHSCHTIHGCFRNIIIAVVIHITITVVTIHRRRGAWRGSNDSRWYYHRAMCSKLDLGRRVYVQSGSCGSTIPTTTFTILKTGVFVVVFVVVLVNGAGAEFGLHHGGF